MFTGYECLDKYLILLRYRYFIFFHQGVEHHFGPNFMGPFSALPTKM